MTGEALFLDIAKIAATIAGFSGVVAAVRRPDGAEWDKNEMAGLKLLLEQSFGALFLGILPVALYLHTYDEPTVWFRASLVFAVFLSYEILIEISRILQARPRKPGLLIFIFFPATIAFLVFQILNIVSWRYATAYAAGLLWLLLASCIQFMLFLLLARPDSGDSEPGQTLQPETGEGGRRRVAG